MHDISSNDESNNDGYIFFGNEFIKTVKEIKDANGGELIIDLVSCNLMNQHFMNEVNKFEMNLMLISDTLLILQVIIQKEIGVWKAIM